MSNTNWRNAQHNHNIFTGNAPTITQPSRQNQGTGGSIPYCSLCPPTSCFLMSDTGCCSLGESEEDCSPGFGAIYDKDRPVRSCVNITLCLTCAPCAVCNFVCPTQQCRW